MRQYRRVFVPGGSYFFTAVTHQRRPLFAQPDNVQILRAGFRYILQRRPFTLDAIVVLPDHLHCIWTLPAKDADYPTRWRLLKTCVTRQLATQPIWQARYWEHCLRDERDLQRHLDYIHFNPVKHGLVKRAADWPYSSFRRYVARGFYTEEWGGEIPASIEGMEVE